jgi:hypothetical protein
VTIPKRLKRRKKGRALKALPFPIKDKMLKSPIVAKAEPLPENDT